MHLFPDVKRALREMNRVLKKGCKLAVMTFVKRRFLGIKRIHEHIEKKHQAHIFDIDELQDHLRNTGYAEFNYEVYSSMILFNARKI